MALARTPSGFALFSNASLKCVLAMCTPWATAMVRIMMGAAEDGDDNSTPTQPPAPIPPAMESNTTMEIPSVAFQLFKKKRKPNTTNNSIKGTRVFISARALSENVFDIIIMPVRSTRASGSMDKINSLTCLPWATMEAASLGELPGLSMVTSNPVTRPSSDSNRLINKGSFNA